MNTLAKLLMLLALGSVGCVTLPMVPWQDQKGPVPTEKDTLPLPEKQAPTPPQAVQPDQISPQSAHKMAEMLRAELEYEKLHGGK